MKQLLYVIPLLLISCASPQTITSPERKMAGEYGDLGTESHPFVTLQTSFASLLTNGKAIGDQSMLKAKGPCADSPLCEIGLGLTRDGAKLRVTDSTRNMVIAEIPVAKYYDLQQERDVNNRPVMNCLKITSRHWAKSEWVELAYKDAKYPSNQISEIKPLVESVPGIGGSNLSYFITGFVIVSENRQLFEYQFPVSYKSRFICAKN